MGHMKHVLPATLQHLPPEAAHFCLQVARFMEKELNLTLTNLRLCVGFSGGADSTALLLALHYLAPRYSLHLSAVHLDHAVRPSSADEAQWCEAFCNQLAIPFFFKRCDVAALQRERKMGLEEAGREARYDLYDEARAFFSSDWIALGHHANDLAEDILMRLIRGAGWPALGGMAGCVPERVVVRPLLTTPRAAIETFLTALAISWITDDSNEDPAYLRNRVRHALLPLFLQENPAFLEATTGLWHLGQWDAAFFAEHMPKIADADNTVRVTPAAVLQRMHKALRLRHYKQVVESMGAGQVKMANLVALDAAWLHTPEPTSHQFSGGKIARIHKKNIYWEKGETARRK